MVRVSFSLMTLLALSAVALIGLLNPVQAAAPTITLENVTLIGDVSDAGSDTVDITVVHTDADTGGSLGTDAFYNNFATPGGGTVTWGQTGGISNTFVTCEINRYTATAEDLSNNSTSVFVDISMTEVVGGLRFDFNQDGKPDVLWRDSVGGSFWLNLTNSAGTGSSGGSPFGNVTKDLNWVPNCIADFNGDGPPDILWRHKTVGNFWLDTTNSAGTGKASGQPFGGLTSSLSWKPIVAIDFSGDGVPDVLWRDTVGGSFWLNVSNSAGTGNAQGKPFGNLSKDLNWIPITAADFSGDGVPDVLWRDSVGGSWWLNITNSAGDSAVSGQPFGNVTKDLNWEVQAIDDFSGDGVPDMLMRHKTGGNFWFYTMNSAGTGSAGGQPFGNLSSATSWKVVNEGYPE